MSSMSIQLLAIQRGRYTPAELYDIEPGQVVFFVSKDGMDKKSSKTLSDIFRFFTGLKKNDIRISVIPTDNEILIGNIACRNIEEISIPYMVVVGPWETIVGLVARYYGVEWDDIMKKVPSMGSTLLNSVSCELPLDFPIYPDRRPVKQSIYNNGDSSDDFGMELLQKRPETEKEKKALVGRYEQKLKKMLWECAYLAININVKGVIEEVEINKNKTKGYGLSLQMIKPSKVSDLIDCKIFVGDGLELKVTPIRKAIYLAFLTLQDGLVIESVTPAFTKTIQKIYRLLPDKEEKDFEENTDRLGIMVTDIIQTKTLRGYMSDINSAIAKLVPNGLIAIELSIEGLKDGAFKVIRSTPEIRNQIIEAFNL